MSWLWSGREVWRLPLPVPRSSAWHRYQQMGATPFADPLLAEIAADPTAIFWG
jgi:hypothetical protein